MIITFYRFQFIDCPHTAISTGYRLVCYYLFCFRMFSYLHRMNITMSQAEKANEEYNATQMATWMRQIQGHHVQRKEMNQLVMNYLVTEGFKEAAEKFRSEAGVEPKLPLNSLDDRIRVREAVQTGKIDEAIELTNSLNPEILDSKGHLFFHLQQQKLIELIRNRQIDEALVFAQDVISELGTENPEFLEEFERTMALLAYEEPTSSPFGDLLNLSQRQMVASELNAAILETDHQETMPKLASVLKLLLWTQNELDKKRIKYPKMTDIASGTIKNSNEDKNTTITIT